MDVISFHVTIRRDNYPRLFESLCDIKQGRQRSEKMQFFAAEFVKYMDRVNSGGSFNTTQPQPQQAEQITETPAKDPVLAASELAFESFQDSI